MQRSVLTLTCVVVAIALAVWLRPAFAVDATGGQTDSNGTHSSVDHHTGSHATGKHQLKATVTVGSATVPNARVEWNEIPLKGNCSRRTISSKRDVFGKMILIDGTVKYWDSFEAVGGESGSWANSVHKPKINYASTAVTVSESAYFDAGEGDQGDQVTYVTFTSTVTVTGSQRDYTYTVDNLSDEELSFTWDMARNNANPTGWSGTVPAEDSVTITHSTSLAVGAHVVYSTASAEGATLNYDELSSSTLVSDQFLTSPDPVSSLVGGQVGSDVVLTWENGGSYDAIWIVRDDEKGWKLAGVATSFNDEDVDAGEHTYEVVGVDENVGSELRAVDVTVE